MHNFIMHAHSDWHPLLLRALNVMDEHYLNDLKRCKEWLPGHDKLFKAFCFPLSEIHYVLMGESPYPRRESANGFAFWDDAVETLWSSTGLSKEVNRATSLRNWIKMLLHARGDLMNDFSQEAIANLDKTAYVKNAYELFQKFIQHGFLLLNATLVYSEGKVAYHARQWRPFIHCLFQQIKQSKPHGIKLILLGRIAKLMPETENFPSLIAEHPYNISFITNQSVVDFFKPFNLLSRHDE